MKPFSIVRDISEKLWPDDYKLPADHCGDVLRGSYDVPFNPKTPPVVLDLGANVGAFVRWASQRWPGCTIHAYEPHPGNFSLLQRTVADIPNVTCYEVAVADKAEASHPLNFAGLNCGEWSLMNFGIPVSSVSVKVISALDLPKADVLKIDVEGAELMVLGALHNRLQEFSAVMMECHADSIVDPIIKSLNALSFTLTSRLDHSQHRVELCFVKTALLPA